MIPHIIPCIKSIHVRCFILIPQLYFPICTFIKVSLTQTYAYIYIIIYNIYIYKNIIYDTTITTASIFAISTPYSHHCQAAWWSARGPPRAHLNSTSVHRWCWHLCSQSPHGYERRSSWLPCKVPERLEGKVQGFQGWKEQPEDNLAQFPQRLATQDGMNICEI